MSQESINRAAMLFAGGGQRQNPIPADPRQQTMMQQLGITNPLLQQFGKQLGNLTGVDTRSAMQQVNSEIQGVENPNSYEGKLKVAQAVMKVDPMQGSALLAAAEEERIKKERREQAVTSNLARARQYKLPESTIEAYKKGGITDDQLNQTIGEFRDKDFAEKADQLKKDQKIVTQVKLAQSRNVGPEVIDSIKNGDFAGDEGTQNLMSFINGETTDNVELMDSETGQSAGYFPEQNGRILVDGKWQFPRDVNKNWVPAQKRTQTGAKSTDFAGAPNVGQTNLLAAADSVATRVINSFDDQSITDALVNVGLSKAGIPTDKSSQITEYNNLMSEALLRVATGAAFGQGEVDKYMKLVGIDSKIVFSPTALARRLVFAKTLTNIGSRMALEDIPKSEVKAAFDKALAADFSDAEKELLKQGKYSQVIGKYADLSAGKSGPATLSSSAQRYLDMAAGQP